MRKRAENLLVVFFEAIYKHLTHSSDALVTILWIFYQALHRSFILLVWLVEFESIRGIEVYIGLLEQEEEAITMMSSFIVYLYPGGSPLFNRKLSAKVQRSGKLGTPGLLHR